MASLMSESDALREVNVRKRADQKTRPPTTSGGSNEEVTVAQSSKKPDHKTISFFVRGSILFNNQEVKDAKLESEKELKGKIVQNGDYDPDSDTLTVSYMCREYSAGNMLKHYNSSPLAKIYNIIGFSRTLAVILLVSLLE